MHPTAGARTTSPLRYTQAHLDGFAEVSGDHNPIHVDPTHPATATFGGTVAHGMLLYASLDAAVERWLGEPFSPRVQHLTFPAPTYPEVDYTVELRSIRHGRATGFEQRIEDARATATALGFAAADAEPGSEAVSAARDTRLGALEIGMEATATRCFSPADVSTLRRLTGLADEAARAADGVPRPLLGGAVSELLGMHLPGPGSKWLKQTFEFFRQVPLNVDVDVRVRITNLRPAKHLVDLAIDVAFGSTLAVGGRSLVLAAEVERAQ